MNRKSLTTFLIAVAAGVAGYLGFEENVDIGELIRMRPFSLVQTPHAFGANVTGAYNVGLKVQALA